MPYSRRRDATGRPLLKIQRPLQWTVSSPSGTVTQETLFEEIVHHKTYAMYVEEFQRVLAEFPLLFESVKLLVYLLRPAAFTPSSRMAKAKKHCVTN